MAVAADTRTRGPWWAWLFPAALLVHVAEEALALGTFPAWISRVAGVDLSMTGFLLANGLALAAMVAGAWLAARPGGGWALAALGAAVLTNAVFHLAGTAAMRSLSPGTVTAVLLWVPLGAAAIAHALRHARRREVALGIAVGFVAHGAVTLAIAFA